MASTNDPSARDPLARHVPAIASALVLGAAVPIGLLRGAPTVVLWVAFALLAAAVLIFWEALRTALDPDAPGDDDADDADAPSELEARKRAALKALKDIEFERAIGRLSEDDHKELDAKYRAEARAAMRAIDEGLGPWLARAESMLDEAAQPLSEPTARKAVEDKDTADKDTVGKDTVGKDTVGKDTADKDTADKDTVGKDTADKDTADKDTVRDALATHASETLRTLVCPKCDVANDTDALFCKKCGARITPEATDAR